MKFTSSRYDLFYPKIQANLNLFPYDFEHWDNFEFIFSTMFGKYQDYPQKVPFIEIYGKLCQVIYSYDKIVLSGT